MGGGPDPTPPPAPAPPPTPTETSAQAIQAQIDATPRILETQKEFGPQFSQLQLDQLGEFGPQFAQTALELQQEFAPQFLELERELNPELTGASDTLSRFLNETGDEEFNRLLPGLQENVRGAQSFRGLGDISTLGAVDEAVQVEQLRQSLKDRRLNIALSTAGRTPISGIPQLQGQTGTGQLVQNVNPQSIFGAQQSINQFNAQNFGTQGGIFGIQQGAQTAQRGQNIGIINAGLGAAGEAIGCWVASEIFGGWYAPRTIESRHYVNNIAPKWFKDFYLKYGEKIAKFISDKPLLKLALKPLFNMFSDKGRRYLNANL
jgi:hypothetical protein